MKKMSQIVRRELHLLANDQELADSIDAVRWKPGNRLRVILELDIHENYVKRHGYEFRYRNPSTDLIPGSDWQK